MSDSQHIMAEIGDLVVLAQQLGTLTIGRYSSDTEVMIEINGVTFWDGAYGTGGRSILSALDGVLTKVKENK